LEKTLIHRLYLERRGTKKNQTHLAGGITSVGTQIRKVIRSLKGGNQLTRGGSATAERESSFKKVWENRGREGGRSIERKGGLRPHTTDRERGSVQQKKQAKTASLSPTTEAKNIAQKKKKQTSGNEISIARRRNSLLGRGEARVRRIPTLLRENRSTNRKSTQNRVKRQKRSFRGPVLD